MRAQGDERDRRDVLRLDAAADALQRVFGGGAGGRVGIGFRQEVAQKRAVKLDRPERREGLHRLVHAGLYALVGLLQALIAALIELEQALAALRAVGQCVERVGAALRFGLEPCADLFGRVPCALRQFPPKALYAHGEGKRLFALDQKRARLLGRKQCEWAELQRVLRGQRRLELVQPAIQTACKLKRALEAHAVYERRALVRRHGEQPVGLIGGVDARQQLAQPAGNQQWEGGLTHLFNAQIGQHARDEVEEQRIGREDQHMLRPQRILQRVQQIGDAVQRDCGLA